MRFSSRVFRQLVLAFLSCMIHPGAMALESPKIRVGYLEYVHIPDAGLIFHAKIDTGADSSSINAEVIRTFVQNGDTWIRFRLTNWQGTTRVLEKKLVRYTKIKRKLAPPVKRPVVRLSICLGGYEHIGEVSLADRKNFKYQVLVGRSYLSGRFVVDPEKIYLTRPACQPPGEVSSGGKKL